MQIACLESYDGLSFGIDKLSNKLDLPLLTPQNLFKHEINYLLEYQAGKLQLSPVDKKQGGALYVDFNSASTEYRRQSSGIKQEIAKAVGCKADYRPTVLDVTAGLGGDAFVLASLGCKVGLVEKNPVVFSLLEDGFSRAQLLDNEVRQIIDSCMKLLPRQSAIECLSSTLDSFDVIYLDPMFPERQKTAKVKKAMQYFHDIVGFDHEQEDDLLALAREKAGKRVVVKRPKLAPLLADKKPGFQLKGKSVRYDVYVNS